MDAAGAACSQAVATVSDLGLSMLFKPESPDSSPTRAG
jgi:hypothetical protein